MEGQKIDTFVFPEGVNCHSQWLGMYENDSLMFSWVTVPAVKVMFLADSLGR